jgi:hypothetical protein
VTQHSRSVSAYRVSLDFETSHVPDRVHAEFRFYEELNDFLPEERRKVDFPVEVDRARSVKDAIESVGVPHTEVDLIVVDGVSVDFTHLLRGGERVAVYPMFEALDISPVVRLRPMPLRDPRFVADGHLGKLARHLRMAGFDTLWTNHWDDDEIIQIAAVQKRTILMRDKGCCGARRSSGATSCARRKARRNWAK